MRIRLFLFVALVVGQTCWGQNPEYDFYPEFRNVVAPKFYLANRGLSFNDVVARYVAGLSARDRFDRDCAAGTVDPGK